MNRRQDFDAGHLPTCPVVGHRRDLDRDIRAGEERGEDVAHLLGAWVEYFDGGDQESEECRCVFPLADALLPDNEFDVTQAYEALRPFLSDEMFGRLGEALELCPVHFCDAQICADDRDECEAGRS